MLEYAAHAQTWRVDELRRAFEESCSARGLDPDDKLAWLLQKEVAPDAEKSWRQVYTNLAAGRLRLLFIADDIPEPLRRVVEFLNAHMPEIEVLAVEIKQFRGGSTQTLVPGVIGRTTGHGSPHPGLCQRSSACGRRIRAELAHGRPARRAWEHDIRSSRL